MSPNRYTGGTHKHALTAGGFCGASMSTAPVLLRRGTASACTKQRGFSSRSGISIPRHSQSVNSSFPGNQPGVHTGTIAGHLTDEAPSPASVSAMVCSTEPKQPLRRAPTFTCGGGSVLASDALARYQLVCGQRTPARALPHCRVASAIRR